jgi:D-arabinose 5-phosphate isomerase GutQ
MMLREYCENAIKGTCDVLAKLDYDKIEKVAEHVMNADNVFVVADVGRPGLALMNFTERLRQLRIRAYRLEESPPTPSVHKGDIVLIGSVDGEDFTSITFMRSAKTLGIDYDLFTMTKGSTLEKDATETVHFEPEESNGLIAEEYFELALYVVLDAIILHIQQKLGVPREHMQNELPNIF